MNLMPGINVTADALAAEKIRMSVVAQNVANAFTTRGPDGTAYKRQVVSFESFLDKGLDALGNDSPIRRVRIGGIHEDSKPGKSIYNPQHPDADNNGMVTLPNVEVSMEMVDLIASSRAYEANLSVVRTARQLARQALTIGRR